MIGQTIQRTSMIVLLTVALTGCAGNKLQERISLLEDTNRSLTTDLNRAMGDLNSARNELDATGRNRASLDQRLLASQREIDGLREQLANMPVPQEVAPGWTAVPGGAMIAIEGSVLFTPGKVVIRDQARRMLDGIVSTVEGEYAHKDILVFGHTDNTPIKKSGWEDNWQLITERPVAVVRSLAGRGVSTSRLVACGCGQHRPRSANDSDAGRSRNRRVEIFAIEPQPQTGRP